MYNFAEVSRGVPVLISRYVSSRPPNASVFNHPKPSRCSFCKDMAPGRVLKLRPHLVDVLAAAAVRYSNPKNGFITWRREF